MACGDAIQRKDEKDLPNGYAGVDAEGIVTGSALSGSEAKTGTYAIVLADQGKIVLADATGGAFTVSLPAVAGVGIGFVVGVKKVDVSANAITIDTPDAALLEGAATQSLPAQYDLLLFLSDGTNWHIVSKALASALADGSVTNAKLADMAESTIKGRAAGAGTGAPSDLSATQATAILNAMVGDAGAGGTKGLAPAPAAGDAAAAKFLKADGTWSTPSSSSSDVFATIVSKTANYTIVSPTDNGTTYDCDSSGGAFTMTLPTAPSTGFRVAIMRRAGTSAALTVTVQAGGADVIRGPRSTAGTSFALQLYESVVLTYYATPGVWLCVAHSSTADAGTAIASLRTLGTGGAQACAGNDARLSDNRIPTDASVTEAKLTDAVWTAIYMGV